MAPKPLTVSTLDAESARVEGTVVQSPRPSLLWKKHFDMGFFKSSPSGTAAEGLKVQAGPLAGAGAQGAALPENVGERLARQEPYIVSFRILQEWDGYVIDVGRESFRARLTDLTGKGAPDAEEVEIPFDELDDDSRSQLAPGRLFRWSVGYERSRAGQKTRVSRIIVRRLPAWSSNELRHAQEEAERFSNLLQWE